jgi:hypothetical protein
MAADLIVNDSGFSSSWWRIRLRGLQNGLASGLTNGLMDLFYFILSINRGGHCVVSAFVVAIFADGQCTTPASVVHSSGGG